MLKKLAATGVLGFAITGALMTAAGPASADAYTHGGHGTVLSGNQILSGNDIKICGNSTQVISVISGAFAQCDVPGHHPHRHS
ncbi:hypothetical protein [Actinomadura rugatobispora]|uniref:DUF320 domain-containing protein n=1 Tax=Actinomadura rugatobispora TaxID=1994 RepID=A0ABW1AHA2_9ACTN|nr:hypothetical protein GCM10010200_031940 [Actinomadura rugatobispora]